MAGIWPCGKITLIGELFGSESLTQVYGFLHTFVFENGDSLKNLSRSLLSHTNAHNIFLDLVGIICYDDGCHLKRYVEKRKDLSETSKQLASYHIVVDKMHFRGHTDRWCQENCNCHSLMM